MNNRKEIYEEIYDISPAVASLIQSDKKGEVPDHYFETLEEQIMSQVVIDKQLQRLYGVECYPDKEYFSFLDDRILSRIKEDAPEKQLKGVRIYFLSALKYAAMLLVLIGAVFVFKQRFISTELDGEIFDEAYIEYLKKNIDDVDINMLIQTDVVTEEVLKEIPEYPDIRHDKILEDNEY